MTIYYRIEFFSYWHVGSGLIAGAKANSSIKKDALGLPMIPARSLKGLLRDASQQLMQLGHPDFTQTYIDLVFGEAVDQTNNRNNYNRPGASFFDAYMDRNFARAIHEGLRSNCKHIKEETSRKRDLLYSSLPSTSITKDGQVKPRSLREIEVTIPLVMYSRIDQLPDQADYKRILKTSFGFVKELGANRNRGLGKCKFSIID